MSLCVKINKKALHLRAKTSQKRSKKEGEGMWILFGCCFFFSISVDRTSAAQTQGAHLDTHIWVCTSQAAGNCVSECAIRALGCAISCCARGLVMPQRSQRHMTTGHGSLALFFRSVAIPPLFLFEVEQSAGGGNWEMIATGRHRGE